MNNCYFQRVMKRAPAVVQTRKQLKPVSAQCSNHLLYGGERLE